MITGIPAIRAACVRAETRKMLAQPLGDHPAGSYKVINRILIEGEPVLRSPLGHRLAAEPVYSAALKRQAHPVCF